MLFVPPRPYLPLGSLRAVVSYPAPAGTFSDERIREVLALVELGHLAGRLDDAEPWDQQLSAHEHQRLAIARVLLHEPEWIFLDEATSALDEAMEERVFRLLAERLPHAALLSIAPRSAAQRLLQRRWTIADRGDGTATLQAA
jgi:putative ATP-binding cassette transporter